MKEKIKIELKTPISYYGGKQLMLRYILPNIPEHRTYIENFVGGGAVFWAKKPSELEVLNDTNRELMNFYAVLQTNFDALEKEIRKSLYSADIHRKASVVYTNPDMFSKVKRAWALWVLASMGYSGLLDSSFGVEKTENKRPKAAASKRKNFTIELSERLEKVILESRDALKIIDIYDYEQAFFYCDPPYFNSDMGHYDGYTIEDFEKLLKKLSELKGKFLLSSYPSEILKQYTEKNRWSSFSVEMIANISPISRKKLKTEVLTANYPLKNAEKKEYTPSLFPM